MSNQKKYIKQLKEFEELIKKHIKLPDGKLDEVYAEILSEASNGFYGFTKAQSLLNMLEYNVESAIKEIKQGEYE